MEQREPLSLVLVVSRAAGLAPYASLQQLRASCPARLYSCCLHVAMSIISMCLLPNVDKDIKLVWLVNLFLLETIIWTSIVRGPNILRDILYILTQVKKICRLAKYEDIAAQRRLRRMFISIAVPTIATQLLILVVEIFSYDVDNILSRKQPPGKWFLHTKSLMSLMLIGQFVLLSTKVTCALAAVNCALRRLCADMCPRGGPEEKDKDHYVGLKEYGVSVIHVKPKLVATFDPVSGAAAPERLRSLACAYVSACGLARRLGATAGPLILMTLVFHILNLLQGIYFVIVNTSQLNPVDIYYIVYICTSTVNLFLYFARIMFLVSPCHDFSEELENTRYLVSHLSCEVSPCSGAFRAELDVFLIHLACHQPHYSALGVCTLGRPLMLTIAAFLVTYLALLLGI